MNAPYQSAADGLSLAAAPSFAIMALLTAVVGGGPLDRLCSGGPDASPLTGMVAMYVLMSAFHSAPWLRLISGRRRGATVRAGENAVIVEISRTAALKLMASVPAAKRALTRISVERQLLQLFGSGLTSADLADVLDIAAAPELEALENQSRYVQPIGAALRDDEGVPA